MSYHTWHDYGYGICISDLKEEIKLERLVELVKTAPNLYKNINIFLEGKIEHVDDIIADLEQALS